MDLGMLDRFCPSLKTRALLDERKFDMNNDRYVIPMHRKNVWTNRWMQDPRKNLLQASYHDPGAQYRKSWGSFKRKRGLTLCYSCRKPGHLAKECPGGRTNCLCCKAMDHEVLDFPRMIDRLEKMNIEQEKPKGDQETQIIEEPQKESEIMLLKMKDTLNDHRDINLLEILKKKEQVEVRIGDFDIDCTLDEETPINIMTESTWETLGRPALVPSLGGVSLFKGKLVTLCGRITQIAMTTHGTSTEEDFEIVKFMESSAPFPVLLGKTWIVKDQSRKQEEADLEQKKQELKAFVARRIAHLIEEREDNAKLFRYQDLNVRAERVQEQESRAPTPEPMKEETPILNPTPQREVTMPKEEKNQNGKRLTETKLTGKKSRKLMKKKAKLEKLQNVPEGTPQKENMQNLNFARISEQRHPVLRRGEAI
jgi:hypothetical protein